MKSPRNSRDQQSEVMSHAEARTRGRVRIRTGTAVLRLIGLLGTGLACSAQQLPTQDAFFHRGAQHFLSGSNQLAKAEVERGLQLHPEDPHLKKFWELLNQQQQDSQNSEDQKNEDKKDQNDQAKQDQKKQDQKDGKDPSQPNPQKPEQDQQDQQKGQKPDDKEQQQQQQQQSGKKDPEKKDGEEAKAGLSKPEDGQEGDPEGQAQQGQMIRMTPQQAIQLMETIKGDERTLVFKPVLRTNRTEQLRKNW